MTLQPPIRYRDDLESVQADEAETHAELEKTFDQILEQTAQDYRHAVRSVHAKAHGLFVGTLAIDGDLPHELAQGLFARGGEHPVLLRFSTNPGDIIDDAVSVPRGLAIKVLEVEGERLPGAEGATQDFVMNNGKAFNAASAEKFLGNLKLLAKTTDRAEGAKVVLSKVLQGVNTALSAVGIESATVKTLGGAPQSEPLGETYNSVTPFRYGDYVAKFQLRPLAPGQQALAGETVDLGGDRDGLRHRIRGQAAVMAQRWEFSVQLMRDPEAHPIEEPTTEWDEAISPFQRVGEIRVAPQDSWSEALQREVDEGMRFSVWTGLAAHRPLGSINRARNSTYRHSADFRARFNGCPIHEPTQTPEPATEPA